MENEKIDVQADLTQVARHGFALYSDDWDMIAWVIAPGQARTVSGATFIVNVQNGVAQRL